MTFQQQHKSRKFVLSKPISNAQQLVFLTLDDRKIVAIHISHAKTLQELRMQLEKLSVTIEAEDQFVIKGYRIAFEEEAKCRIHEAAEDSMVAMRTPARVQSAHCPSREASSGTYGLIATTTNLTHDHSMDLTNHRRDLSKWKAIYDQTSLLRGRRFLPNGAQIGDYPLIKLKHNWRPNSFPSDDAQLHFEMSHHQDSKEYLDGKKYNMNVIANLPFVNLEFGFSHNRQQLSVMNVEKTRAFFYYKLPRIVHIFNPEMIEAEPAFISKIDHILDHSVNDDEYHQLCKLFDEYGHGYATRVVLGGQQVYVLYKYSDRTYDEEEQKKKVKGIFELICNEVGIGTGLEWSKIRTDVAQKLERSLAMHGSIMGGDSLERDTKEWCKALKDPMTWTIIEYQCIEPVYKLLDSERQRKIEIIIDRQREIEQQRPIRCRIVPDKLIFYSEEGVYRFSVQSENYDNSDGCRSLKVNDLFLFFYSPNSDWWFWRRNEHDKTPWKPLKGANVNEFSLAPVRDIMVSLLQTNPKPIDDIVAICSKFEPRYIPNATISKLVTDVTNCTK